jgi:hypothetical protein
LLKIDWTKILPTGTPAADSVCHAIRIGDHPRHGTDAHQSNLVVADLLRNAGFVHGLGIAVDQQDFVARRSERL